MADRRLSFLLDGRDGLSRVLDRVGDNANRLHRRFSAATTNTSAAFNRLTGAADHNAARINASMRTNTTAVRGFTADANGRLRDLNGRFAAAGDGARRLQGDISNLNGPMRGAAAATGEASAAGGALGPVLGGVAVVIGASLLPALGALVPMMAGAGLAAGTLGLGFAGVGDALEAAGKDQEKYQEALKEMSPESRSFTKELVSLKKEFGGLGKDIQKVMLPGFTRALKDARPVVDILGKGMVQLGQGFGEAAAGAGRLFKSGGFQSDLKTNLDLGMSFVRELSGGFGSLLRGLLDFGAKSKPTLDAFSTGLSGLLGKGGGGLVGMFKGLEVGIGGSAKFLDGLFAMINKVLPALGRFAGETARAMGPLFGEMFRLAGDQAAAAFDTLGQIMKGLSPVFKDLGFGIKAVHDIFAIFAPVIRDVGSAIFGTFLPSFAEIDKARGPLQRLSDSIQANKGTIQEVARIMGGAFISMAGAAIEHLPGIIGIFRVVTSGMVVALGGVLHAAASAFGWIPGIGDMLKAADDSFGDFQSSFISGLGAAEASARSFAANALPKLQAGKLKMDINSWNAQIETAKAKLKTVPPEKRAAVRANIADLQNKVAAAKRDLMTLQNRVITVTTRYVVVGDSSAARKSGSYGAQLKYADGGLVGYPGGGVVRGPGTGTSDSILARVSNGEFVIKAKSVARYGASFLAAINEGRLGMAGVVNGAGGDMAGAGAEAGRGLQAGLRASAAGVDGAARGMAAAVTAGVRAELEIASPSKKMRALMGDVGKGMILGLTGSKAKIAETAKDLAKDIWAAWSGVKTTKDSRLVAMVNRDTKKLQGLAAKRDILAGKIAGARQNAATWTAGAREDASLGSLGIEEGQVTAGSIQSGLSQKLAKFKQFGSYIQTLGKRGLAKSMLKQILNMGPEQGFAYASSLAGASNAALKQINSLQYSINAETDKLGKTGADVMYDSGANAGKGFLTGLASQQKAIEAQMLKIARGMDKAIRKALGIKSPSTVAAKSGGYFTQGLGLGAMKQIPFLDRAMTKVTGRMVTARPAVGRPAVVVAGGGRQTVIENHFHIEAMDTNAAAREVHKMLVKLGRNQGATVSLAPGR
ncbi:hypothetical protein [Streptomyces sp. B1I3]|uniref:hypothetical protein n=1 Tax=Streptomyces sp. B1I3 TaxID=3042264 RepID=UPI002785C7E2|nr:hypothetical protein [Streptomyces sp. B1I3]MDQ0795570.1 hypothetical protein [Streptomyces sp. B1I3]